MFTVCAYNIMWYMCGPCLRPFSSAEVTILYIVVVFILHIVLTIEGDI